MKTNNCSCRAFALAFALLLATATSCRDKKLSYDEIIADFLFEYTGLTAGQVGEAVDAHPLTFAGSEQSPGYVLTLDDSLRFVVPEGSAALRLNDITLNVWREQGSLVFFAAVVDERTGAATVFETWLCGESGFGAGVPPREVQRYISTGYIAGKDASGHRHKATKRLSGKVIRWSDELTVFGSATYSASVPEGSLQTFCYPSDYYELDDRHWLYSRVEVEFSGEFKLDVIDLYTMKKIGVKLGLNAGDEFGCALYSDAGEVRGQLAAYYPFGLGPENAAPLMSAMPAMPPVAKGARYLYRPSQLTKPLTLEEVVKIASETKGWKGAFDFPGKEKKMMEHSTLMDNRKFALVFDNGTVWEYETGENFNMRFRPEGGTWKEERYDAFEADDNLVFFAHVTDNDCPTDALQYAIDLENGLVTCIRSTFDDAGNPRVPRQEWLFGIVRADGISPSNARHAFTDELLGYSYTWEYSDNIASQHVYTTTESFTYAIVSSAGASVMGSFPCKYVKIRDGVYMLSWIEMRSQGIEGILLFNTKTMHDCGTCHGMTHDQTFEFNTFCAESRSAGRYY
ncbi:MAG: molybdenum cofactor biosynthesis F family protein [Tannerellaceae bacterium]|nr:molybdenum cofactor biosynthesis F family protein [Tannerellaceae bacterium]